MLQRPFPLGALVTLLALAGVFAGCSFDGRGGGCSDDSDCRTDRICVDGSCRFATNPVEDENSDGEGGTGADPSDGDSGSTGRDADPTDTDNTDAETRGERDSGLELDGATIDGDGSSTSDTGDVFDGGPSLTCHEFATCQAVVCDPYDYDCRQRFRGRISESELEELQSRQRCVQENCAGETGDARRSCVASNCSSDWERCAREPGGAMALSCSEYHSCVHICQGRSNSRRCIGQCYRDATDQARRRFRAYVDCLEQHCPGLSGRESLRCARNNCSAELSQCWDC